MQLVASTMWNWPSDVSLILPERSRRASHDEQRSQIATAWREGASDLQENLCDKARHHTKAPICDHQHAGGGPVLRGPY